MFDSEGAEFFEVPGADVDARVVRLVGSGLVGVEQNEVHQAGAQAFTCLERCFETVGDLLGPE